MTGPFTENTACPEPQQDERFHKLLQQLRVRPQEEQFSAEARLVQPQEQCHEESQQSLQPWESQQSQPPQLRVRPQEEQFSAEARLVQPQVQCQEESQALQQSLQSQASQQSLQLQTLQQSLQLQELQQSQLQELQLPQWLHPFTEQVPQPVTQGAGGQGPV